MVVWYTKFAKKLFWSALHITFLASSERVKYGFVRSGLFYKVILISETPVMGLAVMLESLVDRKSLSYGYLD